MPDHVHGIIHIYADFYNHRMLTVGNGRDRSLHSLQTNPKIKPLPELIGAYKTTVSKRIHLAGDVMFRWQKSYHEHIIRNERSLNRIKKYIMKNPEKWAM
jgi:putative transposase